MTVLPLVRVGGLSPTSSSAATRIGIEAVVDEDIRYPVRVAWHQVRRIAGKSDRPTVRRDGRAVAISVRLGAVGRDAYPSYRLSLSIVEENVVLQVRVAKDNVCCTTRERQVSPISRERHTTIAWIDPSGLPG